MDPLEMKRGARGQGAPALDREHEVRECIEALSRVSVSEEDECTPPLATRVAAVDRLVDLRAEEAIDDLLLHLVYPGAPKPLLDRITERLPELGAPVLEPALDYLAHACLRGRRRICAVLAKLDVPDRRCLVAFRQLLRDDAAAGARVLADYGDRRARGMLRKEIRKAAAMPEGHHARRELGALMQSYERLGGGVERT